MKLSEQIRTVMHRVARGDVDPERATEAIAKFGVDMFNAGVADASRQGEPTRVFDSLSPRDPRSPEDGTPAVRAAVGVQGGAITHLFRDFPSDMRTRCGLPRGAFPTVTIDAAMSEHGGWAASHGAICVGCAKWPIAVSAEAAPRASNDGRDGRVETLGLGSRSQTETSAESAPFGASHRASDTQGGDRG